MKSPDCGRHDDFVSECIYQCVCGAPPRAMSGHDDLGIERPEVFDRLRDDFLARSTRKMETAHYPVDRHWIEQLAGVHQNVYDAGMRTGRKDDEAFIANVD